MQCSACGVSRAGTSAVHSESEVSCGGFSSPIHRTPTIRCRDSSLWYNVQMGENLPAPVQARQNEFPSWLLGTFDRSPDVLSVTPRLRKLEQGLTFIRPLEILRAAPDLQVVTTNCHIQVIDGLGTGLIRDSRNGACGVAVAVTDVPRFLSSRCRRRPPQLKQVWTSPLSNGVRSSAARDQPGSRKAVTKQIMISFMVCVTTMSGRIWNTSTIFLDLPAFVRVKSVFRGRRWPSVSSSVSSHIMVGAFGRKPRLASTSHFFLSLLVHIPVCLDDSTTTIRGLPQ